MRGFSSGGMWVRAWSVHKFWDHEVCSLKKFDEGSYEEVAMLGVPDVLVTKKDFER